jgi:catechol 2,3-dioxygenase-like lactoylglutathione lyase family enzyme
MFRDVDFIKEKLTLPSITQICAVVKSINKAKSFYKKYLNFGMFVDLEFPFTEVYYCGNLVKSKWKMSFCSLGPIEFELIQPQYGPTIYNDFLIEKGEGLHHIGFDVKNIEEKLYICKDIGISVLQSQKCKNAHSAYLDTEKEGGVIIELIQREGKRA